jgi:hypothetical protein
VSDECRERKAEGIDRPARPHEALFWRRLSVFTDRLEDFTGGSAQVEGWTSTVLAASALVLLRQLNSAFLPTIPLLRIQQDTGVQRASLSALRAGAR